MRDLGQPQALVFSPDGRLLASRFRNAVQLWDVSEWIPQARLTPDPSEVAFSADDPAWKTFTVHTNLDSVLVRANPSGSDPAIEVVGGQQVPTRDFCPAEGNDRPTSGRRDGWSLHVKACQVGQTKILLIDYDTGEVLQQYEVNVIDNDAAGEPQNDAAGERAPSMAKKADAQAIRLRRSHSLPTIQRGKRYGFRAGTRDHTSDLDSVLVRANDPSGSDLSRPD